MESENPADLGFIPIADGDDEISKLHKGFLAELKRHEDTLELIEQSYVKGGLRGSSTTSMGKPNSKGKSREDSTPSPAAAGADMISKLAALSKEGLEKEINGVLKEFDNAVENGIPSDGYFTTGFDGGDFYRGGMVTTPTMLYPSASEDHNGGGSATSTRGSVDGTSLSRERNGSSRRGGSASTGDAESPSMRTVAKQRQAQLNADAKEHCTLFLFAAMQLLDSSRNTEGSPSSNRLIDCESFNSNHTPGEIIRSGPLKKSKGDTTTALSVTRWAQKHCVLVPGFLNYYKVGVRSNESKSSLAGITGALFNRDDADDYEGGVGGGAAGIFGRTSKSTTKGLGLQKAYYDKRRRAIPLGSNTICRAVEGSSLEFEITEARSGDKSISRKFMAETREQRDAWLRSLRTAVLLSKLGHAKDREKSIDLCQRVKENIFESVTAQEYLRSVAQYLVPNAVLGGSGIHDAPSPPLCVPIEWVHGVDRRNAAARKGDFGVHQLFKDLRRDTYEINGKTYHGSAPHGAETIIGKLASCILSASGGGVRGASSRVASPVAGISTRSLDGNESGTGSSLDEAGAFSLAMEVLLDCTRTEVGGDTFSAVNELCGQLQVRSAMAVPIIKSNSSSSLASALKINVVGVDRLMEMQLEMEEESLDKAATAAAGDGAGNGAGARTDRKIATFPNSAFTFTGSPKMTGGKSMKVSRTSESQPETRDHKRSLSAPPSSFADGGQLSPTTTSLGPFCHVEATMDYAICDGESLDVWVEVSALYKRSFLVAQGDPISIGPGTVFLTGSLTEAGHSAMLHEPYYEDDGEEDGNEDDDDEEEEEEEEEKEEGEDYVDEEDEEEALDGDRTGGSDSANGSLSSPESSQHRDIDFADRYRQRPERGLSHASRSSAVSF